MLDVISDSNVTHDITINISIVYEKDALRKLDFLYCYIPYSYVPSQADSVVYAALSGAPSADLMHALRWFNQISSYNESERKG